MLSNNGLCLRTAVQYVLLFLVLTVNSAQFRILQSYTVLLYLLFLMRSCQIYTTYKNGHHVLFCTIDPFLVSMALCHIGGKVLTMEASTGLLSW